MAHIGFEILDKARKSLMTQYESQNINIFKIEYVATFEDWDDGVGIYVFFKMDDELNNARNNEIIPKIEKEFLTILERDNYPFDKFPRLNFVFDSDENVKRNFEGSYFYRLR